MDVFKQVDGLRDDELHAKFKLLRDEPYYSGGRVTLESWVSDFCDRDNKIAAEFQRNFHSALWEFYLHAVFKEIGEKLNLNQNRPDFIVEGEDGYYVEAVVSEIKKDGIPESERTLDDHFSMLLPIKTDKEFSGLIDEAIVRHSNSLNEKLRKYTGYANKNGKWVPGYKDCAWVKAETPYIIALASYDQVNYGREYIYSMLALLYGWYYSPERKRFNKRESVTKPGTDSKIDLGLFNTERMREVSAVIFCNTLTLGKLSSLNKSVQMDPAHVINVRYDFEAPHYKIHEVSTAQPEHLLDGLYIFHNPNAMAKFSCREFRNSDVLEISLEGDVVVMNDGRRPIVARYCSPNGHGHSQLLMATAASEFNETVAYNLVDQ
jgi:hypothetical protein